MLKLCTAASNEAGLMKYVKEYNATLTTTNIVITAVSTSKWHFELKVILQCELMYKHFFLNACLYRIPGYLINRSLLV